MKPHIGSKKINTVCSGGVSEERKNILSFKKVESLNRYGLIYSHSEDKEITKIFSFWYHAVPDGDATELTHQLHFLFWFARNDVVDTLLKDSFQETRERALRGELEHWKSSPRGVIALVLLLDQFSRNMYRDTPKMFSADKYCLPIALQFINDPNFVVPAVCRMFLNLALSRHEDIEIAELRLAETKKLIENSPPLNQKFFRNGLVHAEDSLAVLKKFKRFPYRNAVLGRKSTPEEKAYLSSNSAMYRT